MNMPFAVIFILYNYMTGATQIRTKNMFTASIAAAAVYIAASALIFPERTADSVLRALEMSASKVIPSLFAFCAAYRILSPALFAVFRKMKCLCRFFGVSAGGMCMIFSGLFSGFPMGAVMYSELRRAGCITENEGRSLMPYTNNAGAAFLIGALGVKMVGSAFAGAMLFACQTASALALILFSRGEREITDEKDLPKSTVISPSHAAKAIAESGASMIGVAAFIVFFSVLGDALSHDAHLPDHIAAAVRSLLEISSGAAALSSMGSGGVAFLGFCVGASGISVYMQCDLSSGGEAMARYGSGKAAMSSMCGALFALCALFSGIIGAKEAFAAAVMSAAVLTAAALWHVFRARKTKCNEKKKNIEKTVEKLF